MYHSARQCSEISLRTHIRNLHGLCFNVTYTIFIIYYSVRFSMFIYESCCNNNEHCSSSGKLRLTPPDSSSQPSTGRSFEHVFNFLSSATLATGNVSLLDN